MIKYLIREISSFYDKNFSNEIIILNKNQNDTFTVRRKEDVNCKEMLVVKENDFYVKEVNLDINIFLKQEQLNVIIRALDLYSRIFLGQYKHIVQELRRNYVLDYIKLEHLSNDLEEAKSNFTGLPENTYYSVLNEEYVPEIARIAADLAASLELLQIEKPFFVSKDFVEPKIKIIEEE